MHIDRDLQIELESLVESFLNDLNKLGAVYNINKYSLYFKVESILIIKFISSYLNTLSIIDNENLINAIDKGICSELNKNDFDPRHEVFKNLKTLLWLKFQEVINK